ncbi:hypothetical protein ACD591_19315 [Rufibacter glacialis]|uniref:Uncharacterized protein n=1 Tax=Rufibacter glacialis TaxID=1259555 RepID=A0A5M8Q5R3_9BACT|nr:hypothetical protein [Rufibacter glacialis]KAA6430256.1 hypothetical protein FOE74_20800 [Rufibacter glacialis]GGK87761.1 hypothetical protein GCM10011405_39350 [Rufibacter glacialis]
MKENKRSASFWFLSGVLVSTTGILAFMNLEEWCSISVLQRKTGYPFGGEGPTPYYYTTPDLYATVSLVWGILFSAAMAFGIGTIVKKSLAGLITALGITMLLAVSLVAHGTIE